MSSLKSRINKLYTKSISDVSSRIVVLKKDEVVKKVTHGNNKEKVIEVVVRL